MTTSCYSPHTDSDETPGTGTAMIKRSSQALAAWFLTWDLSITASAWVGAYFLRFDSGWIPVTKPPPTAYLCWRNLPLVLLLAVTAYHLTGQYTIHRLRRLREEMVGVVKGTVLMSLLVMASTFYTQDPYDSRVTMVLFSIMTAVSVVTARRSSWYAIRHLRSQGYNQTRSLIVGTGRVARKTAWA